MINLTAILVQITKEQHTSEWLGVMVILLTTLLAISVIVIMSFLRKDKRDNDGD